MKKIQKQKDAEFKKDDKLSRRDALTKIGLSAFSVGTMLLLLNQPGKAQTQDSSLNPDDPDTWPE
ncbi:MAG: hypothetical protein WD512_06725 [Candidatus Paceibacterota bacterium]